MCGIAGMVTWNGRQASTADVHAMCNALVHRGPDDMGLIGADHVALGMRRLSIIDVATSRQPVSNEDGTVWVVFNGEIYNYKDLRADLLSRGHRLATSGDTETIVHLYEEYGADFVDHLRGMFALAVWDTRRGSLLIARDRLGIKPLYYANVADGFVFASELKALLSLPEIEHRLHWPAVGHVFAMLTTGPADSVIAGVHKLEPAHRAVVSRTGRLTIERYWQVAFEPNEQASEDQLVERLRGMLDESVRLHLQSDVPLGLFLSGGLDSSAVAALAQRQTPRPLKTFSVGFADAQYDERPHARAVADTLQTDHYELVVEPQDASLMDDLVWYLDEPFGDSSALPTYMVSKLAAAHVKVVLSGDGGDEIFAGYDRYQVEGRERRREQLPAVVRSLAGRVGASLPDGWPGRRWLRHLALEPTARYLDSVSLFARDALPALFQGPAALQIAQSDPWHRGAGALKAGTGEWLSVLQAWDLNSYLPLDILTKVDRMTMAHSIEARPPLLDHPLVEFAATVPPHLLLDGSGGKRLFKRAMRGTVPDAIIDRPKHGFAVPLARWFRRGQWAVMAGDILDSERCRSRGIFDRAAVQRVLRQHRLGRDLDLQIWTLLTFELWCRRFLDAGRPQVARQTETRRDPIFRPAAQGAAG